jgi:hypothetical protein
MEKDRVAMPRLLRQNLPLAKQIFSRANQAQSAANG